MASTAFGHPEGALQLNGMTRERVGIVILATNSWLHVLGRQRHARYRWKRALLETVDQALASTCQPIVVVLGSFALSMRDDIALPRQANQLRVAVNWAWREGDSAAVRQGLTTLDDLPGYVGGTIIARTGTLASEATGRLVSAYRTGHGPVVAACSSWRKDAEPCLPALFSRDVFPALMSLRGTVGAEDVVRRHGSRFDMVRTLPGLNANDSRDRPDHGHDSARTGT